MECPIERHYRCLSVTYLIEFLAFIRFRTTSVLRIYISLIKSLIHRDSIGLPFVETISVGLPYT